MGCELHRITGAERPHSSGNPQNAIRRGPIGVAGGKAEFNFRVCCLRPDVVLVRIQSPKIVVEDLQLLEKLGIGDVLRAVGVDHMKYHRDGHDHRLHLCTIGPGFGPRLHECGRVLFEVCLSLGIDGIEAHHLHVLFVGGAFSLGRRCGDLGLSYSEKRAQKQGGN